jgi:hypothetical protein
VALASHQEAAEVLRPHEWAAAFAAAVVAACRLRVLAAAVVALRRRSAAVAAVTGALIGGAIASQSYGYYGGPGYYAPGYYDDQYYDDSAAVAVAPGPVGGDDVAYCMQTYQSYDPASGTYLGFDGLRHPCP